MPDLGERAEQARRRAEGLAAIRLRYCINTHLEDQSLTTPVAGRRRRRPAGRRQPDRPGGVARGPRSEFGAGESSVRR